MGRVLADDNPDVKATEKMRLFLPLGAGVNKPFVIAAYPSGDEVVNVTSMTAVGARNGNVVEMVTVEKVETGWRLIDSAGNTGTVAHLPGDESGPDEAA